MDTSHRKGIYQIGVKAPIFFIGANNTQKNMPIGASYR